MSSVKRKIEARNFLHSFVVSLDNPHISSVLALAHRVVKDLVPTGGENLFPQPVPFQTYGKFKRLYLYGGVP